LNASMEGDITTSAGNWVQIKSAVVESGEGQSQLK